MPCFHDVSDDRFLPIGPIERDFLEALVELAPDVLAPMLTQLDAARACDPGHGWLAIRDAAGEPVPWPVGYPFDIVVATNATRGPQECYNIMLWFHSDGQLDAVEFLLSSDDGPLDLSAFTQWLRSGAALAQPDPRYARNDA